LPIGSGDRTDERREIVAALRTKLTIGESVPDLATSADLVDAAVCVFVAADFISGRAMNPEDRGLAEREGWDLDRHTEGLRTPIRILVIPDAADERMHPTATRLLNLSLVWPRKLKADGKQTRSIGASEVAKGSVGKGERRGQSMTAVC
jgi:hypothetical protein